MKQENKTKGVGMKKLMMLATAIAAAMPIMAETETVGSYTWTYQINGDAAEIYNEGDLAVWPKPTGAVTIPYTLGGKPVTSIGAYAFAYYSGLTSVTIPNSVTSIGEGAFAGCSGLTSVTIPNSVTKIGEYAFGGCSGLTSVTIPDGVTSIGSGAFCDCSGLTSVTIGNSVTSIAAGAFSECSGLTSISVGAGNPNYASANGLLLSKDGKMLIKGINGDVTIPNSVTSIGEGAFAGCSGLTSVTIPDSVTSIGELAFEYCSGLTSVTIPDGVTSIGRHAFEYCSGLTSVTIPQCVFDKVFSNVFYGCSIPNVVISDSVTSIREYAFYDWADEEYSEITSVTIPDSVTNIGSYAFSSCKNLTSIYITDLAKWCAISLPTSGGPFEYGANLFLNGEKVTDLIIPDGVTSIGDRAFRGCGGLTSVTIPDSVTSIGKNAFENCSSLRSIKLPSNLVSIGPNAFDNTPAYSIAQLRPLVTADGVLGGSLTSESSAGSASSGGATSGGSSSSGYVLSETVGDSTITSMTVSADTSIDSFLLADGQVFDMAIRIVNVAESAVRLSLPSDYDYETIGSADPLEIPASSTNMVTITRTAAKTFLVSRQQLRAVR